MQVHTITFRAMGTACEICLATPAEDAQALARLAIDDVERLESRYSRYRDTSDLSSINRVAVAGGTIEVDRETAALLDYADACHRQSDGAFDITSGILRRAWRFASGILPQPVEVQRWLALVGWGKVSWRSPHLAFPVAGMELDLGGIVKEYAVDRAATLLQEAGVAHGYINLGGDVRAIGPQPDGTPWRIGIRHPRQPDAVLLTLEISKGALASSGDYERCIVAGGRRFGHILDARTGWPVTRMAAVSVVAPLCVVAGSAATIGMLQDASGPDWLQALGLPCLWMDVDGRCGGSLVHGGRAGVQC